MLTTPPAAPTTPTPPPATPRLFAFFVTLGGRPRTVNRTCVVTSFSFLVADIDPS